MTQINIDLIKLFDQHLKKNEINYKASIIGGTAVMLIASQYRATGDIDSLKKIPKNVREEVVKFAKIHSLDPTWFNDHASRNFSEFVRKGEDIFAHLVFDGEALKLYMPSIKTLLLSKIYPILDRPEESKDLQDIDVLLATKVVKRKDFEDAIATFEENIRFEDDSAIRKASRNLILVLRKLLENKFS